MDDRKRVPVAVLVSGGGTNLQALLDAVQAGKRPHVRIVRVISDRPGAFALERAARSGIPHASLDRKAPDFEEHLQRELDASGARIIVLAGFLSILSPEFTARHAGRMVNVHPSLIPSFCGTGFYGLRVHEAALARGVRVTGATVHLVNEIPDGGRILAQKAVEVLPGDTPEVLQRRVMEQAEWVLLPACVEDLCRELSGAAPSEQMKG